MVGTQDHRHPQTGCPLSRDHLLAKAPIRTHQHWLSLLLPRISPDLHPELVALVMDTPEPEPAPTPEPKRKAKQRKAKKPKPRKLKTDSTGVVIELDTSSRDRLVAALANE